MKTDPLPTYPSLIIIIVVVVGQSLKKNKSKSETCETCNFSVKRSERKTRPATGRGESQDTQQASGLHRGQGPRSACNTLPPQCGACPDFHWSLERKHAIIMRQNNEQKHNKHLQETRIPRALEGLHSEPETH